MKVFCIGSNKTGTTSLSKALTMLGLSVCPIGFIFDQSTGYLSDHFAGRYDRYNDLIEKYDAFHDRPWNHLKYYEDIDKEYDQAKFILTLRDSNDWERSYQAFARKIKLRHRWFYKETSQRLYGVNDFLSRPDVMITKYEERNAQIMQYYKYRDNFLAMNIMAGDGFDVLCSFLSRPNLTIKFPHERRGQ